MFDLDGTVVDTATEIQRALNDTLRCFGLGRLGIGQVKSWIGKGTEELLVQALSHSAQIRVEAVRASELLQQTMNDFSAHYQRHCGTSSQLYPFAREVLDALGRRGVKRAIVTNKEQRFAVKILRSHHLLGMVDRVIYGDTLPTRKPNPDGILDSVRTFAVPLQCALFIGDSFIDVATARNAGVAIWALSDGYNMGRSIAEARPDRILSSLQPVMDEIAPPVTLLTLSETDSRHQKL